MKFVIYTGIIVLGVSISGCTSSKYAEIDSRVSKLENNTPVYDDVTQKVLDIAIGGPLSHNNKPSKADAVLALALFERTETAPEILQLAKATQNDHFRMECVNALGWMNYKEAIPYLKETMKNDSYKHTRRAAAVALETMTGEVFLTEENGFETQEMILERFKREMAEKRKSTSADQRNSSDESVQTEGSAAEL